MHSETILVDANALADFFVGQVALRADAEALRRKFPDWMTLPLCRYEFGNVLRTYTRQKMIETEDGRLMLRQGLGMVTYCPECEPEVVLAEANAYGLTFYDASYVARARALGMQLYTRDKEVLKNCPDVAVPIAAAREMS